jgi:hypothetical protein
MELTVFAIHISIRHKELPWNDKTVYRSFDLKCFLSAVSSKKKKIPTYTGFLKWYYQNILLNGKTHMFMLLCIKVAADLGS